MRRSELVEFYLLYIACLNLQDWLRLGDFVDDDVQYNGLHVGLEGYRRMLQKDFAEIPDLRFAITLLVAEVGCIGSRLRFDCSPKGTFLGVPVNGKRVSFSENVFYEIGGCKIVRVWSVVDRAAIEAQL